MVDVTVFCSVKWPPPATECEQRSCSVVVRRARASRSFPPPSFRPCALQRDGCPKIINLGSAKTDLFYERKKYGEF